VRKLLAFSRKDGPARASWTWARLIGDFEVLLRRLLREDVRLETDYGRDLPLVLADKSQLEIAVMNLAVNARDAMRGKGRQGQGRGIRPPRCPDAQAPRWATAARRRRDRPDRGG
jgi:two-component system cell cycle sensor histidine kinase/response regulator CckA